MTHAGAQGPEFNSLDIRKTGVGFTRVIPELEKQSWGLLRLWDGWPCLLGVLEVNETLQ